MNILNMPLTDLSGVGEKRKIVFSLLGINSVYDLLFAFPVRYQDRSEFVSIDSLCEGMEVCVKATLKNRIKNIRVRKSMLISQGNVFDESGEIGVVWYNNRFMEKTLRSGTEYIFFGKISKNQNKLVLSNPTVETLKNEKAFTGKILPVYKSTKGITQKVMQKAVWEALEKFSGLLPEILPLNIRQKFNLMGIVDAVKNVHFPETEENALRARRRFVFEELFLFQAGLYKMRTVEVNGGKIYKTINSEGFYEKLEFTYTNAQKKVSEQIKLDFKSGKAMKRLIQGDVGSGKTAIALEGIYLTAQNGMQSALMAPTEILARQHYLKAREIMPHLKIELLTSSVKKSEKMRIIEATKSGECDVLIGTHALIEPDVTFKNLAFVVADEQHRFGVRQRQKLIEKGENVHLMVMTATPIPRTLAIIMYGDLAVSVIDELPPGRQQIKTYLVGESMHERIYNFIKKQAQSGGQSYVVCPMVEESDTQNLKAAVEYSNILSQKLKPLKVGLLHGKMKETEKVSVMESFKNGDFDVLVSTTVIEVGVDVPNASLMVIENAERFGLSQLHQLRGRVGRGSRESFCILVANTKSQETISKLRVIESSTDGFYISEQDLLMRGPGDYFGTRQSGLPPLKNSNPVSEVELLYKTKEAWEMIVNRTLEIDDTEMELIDFGIKNMYNMDNNCNIIN